MSPPRYVVGIDLGTTNSVVAWIDPAAASDPDAPDVHILDVPQLVKPGVTEARPRLPSFLYFPARGEMDPASRALPWGPAEHVAGELARARGAEVPSRVVASAKSWLCAVGVERDAQILPWGAPDDVPHVSPVDAAAAYLGHLRMAWDAKMPAPLAEQEVYLAVPASFDAAVPWLLAFATVVLAFGKRLTAALRLGRPGPAAILAGQFLLAIYGGYFGGAVGLMMLAFWTATTSLDPARGNPLRVIQVAAVYLTAAVIFVFAADVLAQPLHLVALLAGAVLGGYGGAHVVRRLPPVDCTVADLDHAHAGERDGEDRVGAQRVRHHRSTGPLE